MGEYEVYTTGGGYYLYDIFNFLAMFSSGSMFYDMLMIGIIVGVFYMAIKIMMTGSLEGVFPYLIIVAVVGGLGIGPKARVIIMDSTYPLEIYGAVDNVPLSVAFVASLTSKTSYEITRRMETLLSTPDSLTYHENGILFGASLMAQAARWRAVTPSIQQNLVNFMENCMVDGTNIGLVNIDELTREGNLAAYIGTNAPGALAFYDEVSESTVTCPDGWADLESALNDEVLLVLQQRAEARAPRTGAGAGIVEVSALTGTLEDFQNMMGMASYDAVSYLKQSMLVLALDDAAGRLIANSGNSAAMSLYQTARAENQTRASYQVVGSGAMKWVPIIKIVFETLYYGAFPLALLLMMTPMAATVAKGYFGGFVWLAAWEPLSAILHTTLLKGATGWYREHTTTLSGSGAGATDVLNWANHFGIQAVEQDISVVAGYMMMSVPFLSFAIFFGATKMAGLATSMLNVSQGSAIETGREAATGSMSLGNVSMNNMSANKWNTSEMMDAGRSTRAMADGGMVTGNADGSRTYSAGSAQSNVGMSAQIGQSVREEVSDRASTASRAVESQSEDFSNSVSNSASQLSDFGMSFSSGSTAGWDNSTSFSQEDRTAVTDAWRDVESFSESHGLSTSVGMQAMLAGHAGLGVSQIMQLGAKMEANGSLNAQSRENFEAAANASREHGYSETLGTLATYAERAQMGQNASEGETGNNSVRSNYDEVQQSAQRYSAAYEQAQSLEHANSYLQSQDMSYNGRLTDAVITELGQQGYSDDQISALVNPKTMAGMARQQEVINEILPDILSELGLGQQNFTAPMAPNLAEAPDLQHTPVDPNNNTVVRPEGGNLSDLMGNTVERMNANGWDDDQWDDAFGGPQAQANVEGTIAAGQQQADGNVGSAFVERGEGVLNDVTGVGGGANSNNIQLNRGVSETDGAGEAQSPLQNLIGGLMGMVGGGAPSSLSAYERDVVARTILAEGGGGDDYEAMGYAALAIKNRSEAPGWGDDPAEVAMNQDQFNAWKPDASGNTAAAGYSKESPEYQNAARIADLVFSGQLEDPTGGSTQYSSPAQTPQYVPGLDNVNYEAIGIRDMPLSDEYRANLSNVVSQLGPEYGVHVNSAGQTSDHDQATHGSEWTGSHRHDVDESGHANTADFTLTRNGEIITPDSDPETYERLFELGASTFSGIGEYGSYVHMGDGTQASWGPDKTSASLSENYRAAINRGRT
ncbi:MAG: conjugal transfer protein TraG N-terminal domain-containing protein [Rhodobacteraceae bacterium]|nr:conjugal transfer protein TraG N-terminal domain-containing protein [Paracoccaceae bacterium]